MNDSKNLAMMFLLGAFLTGGALGFSADKFMNRDKVCLTSNSNSAVTKIMSQRLHLTDAQSRTIDSILDQRSKQWRVEVDPIRPRLDSIKLNSREQMRRVMTEEQKAEFETLIKEMSDSARNQHEE